MMERAYAGPANQKVRAIAALMHDNEKNKNGLLAGAH